MSDPDQTDTLLAEANLSDATLDVIAEHYAKIHEIVDVGRSHRNALALAINDSFSGVLCAVLKEVGGANTAKSGVAGVARKALTSGE